MIIMSYFFLYILVFQQYSKYSKVDVAKAIDLELKGDIENCLTAVGETFMTVYSITYCILKWYDMQCHCKLFFE